MAAPLLAGELEPARERPFADPVAPRDLGLAALAGLAGRERPLAQVGGVGTRHRSPPVGVKTIPTADRGARSADGRAIRSSRGPLRLEVFHARPARGAGGGSRTCRQGTGPSGAVAAPRQSSRNRRSRANAAGETPRRGTTMNQGDLAAAVAEAIGEKKGDAARAVEAVPAAIRDGLERDGEVAIAGFGSLETARREAREGRHPRTGKP